MKQSHPTVNRDELVARRRVHDDREDKVAGATSATNPRAAREIFRLQRAAVLDAVTKCGSEGVTTAVTMPRLTRNDVLAAFDELAEKQGLVGIDMHFEKQDTGDLTAVFVPIHQAQCRRAGQLLARARQGSA